MTEQTYTVKDISKMMGCHPLTVIRWIKAKKLIGFKIGPAGGKGPYRVLKSELDKVMGTVADEVKP